MFGMTAKQWRESNPEQKGNIGDYASINELICLSNMENLNAVFIEQSNPPSYWSLANRTASEGRARQLNRLVNVTS